MAIKGGSEERNCVVCNRVYICKTYSQKYCTRECKQKGDDDRRAALRPTAKPCRDCGTSIPVNRSVLRCERCKDKHQRSRHLHPKYRLTSTDYDRMFAEQGGLCAICGAPPEAFEDGRLCVDHDHDTGQVRGLLHRRCNTAIGVFTTVELLEAAIRYLRANSAHREEEVA